MKALIIEGMENFIGQIKKWTGNGNKKSQICRYDPRIKDTVTETNAVFLAMRQKASIQFRILVFFETDRKFTLF